jgi:hypothetical protein
MALRRRAFCVRLDNSEQWLATGAVALQWIDFSNETFP